MAEETQFQIYYDGEALRGGTIDARELAPALLALADLADAANREVTAGKANIKLKIHSDFQRGSFKIDFSLIVTYYQQFIDFFNTPETKAWATILSILGISSVGLFQLIKKSKGKTPSKVVTIERTETVKIEFDGEEPIEVNKKVYSLFNDHKARRAASQVVEPLLKEGVEELGININQKETLHVSKGEVKYFKAPEEVENEIVSESEKIVRIVAMSFKEGNKWRVYDGDSTKYAIITDEKFLSKVRRRDELFGNNDKLHVKLLTRQWIENGELKTSHEITEVIKHMASEESKQLKLDDF